MKLFYLSNSSAKRIILTLCLFFSFSYLSSQSFSQYVFFYVSPSDAVVSVDDEPYSLNDEGTLCIPLDEGDHKIKIESNDYQPYFETISMYDSSEKITKTIKLLPIKSELTVVSLRDAEIWINNEKKGVGSWNGFLDDGDYLVEARRPLSQALLQKVNLKPHEQRTISLVDFIQKSGSIDIISEPKECSVYLDGRFVGSTPIIVYGVENGIHFVEVQKQGYSTMKEKIEIKDNHHKELSYILEEGEIHDCVDLGLSVKWATCNVGALRPEKIGEYYAWGEIESKQSFNKKNYKYWNDDIEVYTKYDLGKIGAADKKKRLDPKDDVAHSKWKEKWRLPTMEEFAELLDRNNCVWKDSILNGVRGYMIVSRKKGFEGNSIFLPAGGLYENGNRTNDLISGYYMSSDLYSEEGQKNSSSAIFCLLFECPYNTHIIDGVKRYFGFSVRPVCP